MKSLKERIELYKFALGVYSRTLSPNERLLISSDEPCDLSTLGFCAIYRHMAGKWPDNVEDVLPELAKYKPNLFYTQDGLLSSDSSLFWFKVNGDAEGRQRRVLILKEILKSLESNTTEDRF